MDRIIKPMEDKYLRPSLELVEDVFAKWGGPEEGKTVRRLVEEIRAKKYHIPELELIMVSEDDSFPFGRMAAGTPDRELKRCRDENLQ